MVLGAMTSLAAISFFNAPPVRFKLMKDFPTSIFQCDGNRKAIEKINKLKEEQTVVVKSSLPHS